MTSNYYGQAVPQLAQPNNSLNLTVRPNIVAGWRDHYSQLAAEEPIPN